MGAMILPLDRWVETTYADDGFMTAARCLRWSVTVVAAFRIACATPTVASPVSNAGDVPAGTRGPELVDRIADAWSTMIAGLRRGVPGPPSPPGRLAVPAYTTCLAAADGTVDCGAAARSACAQEGFGSGLALDQVTGRICRGNPVTAIGSPAAHGCKRKTWVTRVACW